MARKTMKQMQKTPRVTPFQAGFQQGYDQGVPHGIHSYGKWIDGPSIVIPTYNQIDMLKGCIASIQAHTSQPYEIVVVDNASTDGTADYLRSLGLDVRYTVLESNLGFAGGVNHGLMMARGQYIVVLNNDVVVTPGWLTNMMSCLNSDAGIAVVGPVTNYIGGEQQIEVPYTDVKDMLPFAEGYNKPDPGKWKYTDRLVGFCLLFRRELLNEIGYLDEGYHIGNYEDDDWMIRIRLSGRKLCIAGDSFIHHFGSVSMKSMGNSKFQETNDQNAKYYEGKWGNPHLLIQETLHTNGAEYEQVGMRGIQSYHFYPDRRLVKTSGGKLYWLNNGHKHPLELQDSHRTQIFDKAVRLSRYELQSIPMGDILQLHTLEELQLRQAEKMTIGIPDGSIVTASRPEVTQLVYQLKDGKRRLFITAHAVQSWGIDPQDIYEVTTEQLQSIPQGLPIIAPPILLSPVL
ncbi:MULTISPECIES: glycosyltransferase family 2 protein [unclassified Paenibacillus]|uniref:Glycosyltransferase family 2 protein n=1 Tax=Paenibacillus provencensis TaxID=441151 RepID=A0ABW3Q1E9_9BACL|nr:MULTISPECIES: glycosyltransferase family 2 protein [unclassified Paenibacillus]MCM3129857.1 glycosyltransferase family 2 protein [Paenibacillus sp. MER 78]SFS91451.1 Glycosyltransferase, GT2 family [Paenibacillus sp. 453mf]